MPAPAATWGEFIAWDPVTGKKVWSIKEKFMTMSGALATAGDVVFYGTVDGWFRAVDARTGKVLGRKSSAPASSAAPMTYLGPDGRQYVAIYAGVGGAANGAKAMPGIPAARQHTVRVLGSTDARLRAAAGMLTTDDHAATGSSRAVRRRRRPAKTLMTRAGRAAGGPMVCSPAPLSPRAAARVACSSVQVPRRGRCPPRERSPRCRSAISRDEPPATRAQLVDKRNPLSGNAGAIARRPLGSYVAMNCAGCHGYDARGNMGPNLTMPTGATAATPPAIYKSIYEGRPKGMPAWGRAYPRRTSGSSSPGSRRWRALICEDQYGIQGDHDVTAVALEVRDPALRPAGPATPPAAAPAVPPPRAPCPYILAPRLLPLIGPLRHGGRGGDRVDGDHLG